MKNTHCVFVYTTKADRQAGEMLYTIDAAGLEEARDIADEEVKDGMYCASIFERVAFAAPMQFVEAHIQPKPVAA